MDYLQEITETYEIREKIGEGGGGTVYRAFHKRLQKEVVIKEIKGALPGALNRKEVDILKNLRHSYLPQVLDFLETPTGIYTVMDFIPGKSLQRMLDEGHVFTEKEVLNYAKQICEALSYLHAQKPPIVHGDIKPDNIMVTPWGSICLIDFNISGVLEGQGAQTFGCTPGYSSPEQIAAFERLKKEIQNASGKTNSARNPRGKAVGSQASEDRTGIRQGKNTPNGNIQKSDLAQGNGQDADVTELLWQADKTEMLFSDAGEATSPAWGVGEETPGTAWKPGEGVPGTAWGAGEEASAGEARPAAAAGQKLQGKGVHIDCCSDIYSLGATLYALLSGELLKPSKKKVSLPGVSDGFLLVLNKAISMAPGKRYADAGKMLQALNDVYKKDRKYRRLIRRQELTLVLWFLLLAASFFCASEGVRMLAKEKEDRYELLIGQMKEGVEKAVSLEKFDIWYEEALDLYPHRLGAYFERARYLSLYQKDEDTAEYISQVLSLPILGEDGQRGNIYYLYAECWFRMEDYVKAKFNYQRALNYEVENPEIYRDYAISLVYLDQLSEAEKLLEKAIWLGMTQVDVLLVQGEIERMAGNFGKARECFESVLENAEDEYVRQRAYVVASKMFQTVGTKEALLMDTQWLERAVKELSMNNRLLIYERLVQDFILLGELSGDSGYYKEAVGVLQEIMAMGWDTYLTYSNAVVLCQRSGDTDEAGRYAQEMMQEYPEHYVTWMRLCFLEVERQQKKENKERDYTAFAEYYEKADQYYRQQTSGNVTDAEMQLLVNTYQQIKAGGWLE